MTEQNIASGDHLFPERFGRRVIGVAGVQDGQERARVDKDYHPRSIPFGSVFRRRCGCIGVLKITIVVRCKIGQIGPEATGRGNRPFPPFFRIDYRLRLRHPIGRPLFLNRGPAARFRFQGLDGFADDLAS